MSRTTLGLLVVPMLAATALLAAAPSAAQQPAPQWSTEAPTKAAPPKAPARGTPAPSAKTAPPASKDDGAARSGDSALRQRIEQLEEQLADMQVMIGTIESMGGRGGAPAPAAAESGRGPVAPGGGVDQARLDSLETQMRAISDQLEQLAGQVRQMSNRRGEVQPSLGAPPGLPASEAPGRQLASPEPSRPPAFGTVTVTPDNDRDPIGRLITGTPPASPVSAQALPPSAASASSPKELYETAYGYLLQQDYPSAEAAFDEFLRRHPGDRLAADAQYWLGETLYVQRRYKPAGQAFLKVIEKHQASNKVPNSILKLAQTLDQLGQKDCALFEELETRHANAPADVKSKARALRQKVGC
jgi:tol-pal system protein YbgF